MRLSLAAPDLYAVTSTTSCLSKSDALSHCPALNAWPLLHYMYVCMRARVCVNICIGLRVLVERPNRLQWPSGVLVWNANWQAWRKMIDVRLCGIRWNVGEWKNSGIVLSPPVTANLWWGFGLSLSKPVILCLSGGPCRIETGHHILVNRWVWQVCVILKDWDNVSTTSQKSLGLL